MLKQLDLFGAGGPNEEQNSENISADELVQEAQPETNGPGMDPSVEDKGVIVEIDEVPFIQTNSTDQPTREKKEKLERTILEKKSKRGRKSLKEMDIEAEFIDIPEDEILFSKQYYGIGEVATMFGVNNSLVRYWDTEFDILNPRKNRKGDRLFRPEDIKNLHLIFHLLRQRKYTIEGAKEYLKRNQTRAQQEFELVKRLQKIRLFLLEIKAGL